MEVSLSILWITCCSSGACNQVVSLLFPFAGLHQNSCSVFYCRTDGTLVLELDSLCSYAVLPAATTRWHYLAGCGQCYETHVSAAMRCIQSGCKWYNPQQGIFWSNFIQPRLYPVFILYLPKHSKNRNILLFALGEKVTFKNWDAVFPCIRSYTNRESWFWAKKKKPQKNW